MIDLQEETRLALIAAGFTDAQIDAETAACGGNFDKAADKLLASHPTTAPSVSWDPPTRIALRLEQVLFVCG